MLTQTIGTQKNKAVKSIAALLLSLIIAFAVPFCANAQVTGSIYTSSQYTHNSRFDNATIVSGIDVSVHNGTIDWDALKATDTKVVIIRVGCRGYGSKGTLLHDDKFETNIANALARGFDVGVYFYSQALNEAEAIEEANYVLNYIKPYGFKLPVYYDYEFAGVSSGRLDSAWNKGTINKAQMTKNALAFCQTIENAGYKAGIYASKSFFESQLDRTQLENLYSIWLAHYNTKTTYAGTYQLWQYSSKGKVSGIDGYVDANFVYYDLLTSFIGADSGTQINLPSNTLKVETTVIPDQVYTGMEIKPTFEVTTSNGVKLVEDVDYSVSYANNINIGSATIYLTGINNYAYASIQSRSFNIVPNAVTNVKLEERETNSLKVSWDSHPYADKYLVQVHKSSGWVNAGYTSTASHTVTGLTTASNYKIRVCAVKTINGKEYNGAFSDYIETATIPETPSALSTSNVKPTSFTLNWKKLTNASYYEVYKYNSSNKQYELFSTVKSGKNNFQAFSGLKVNSAYKFKVKAFKQSKDGELLESDFSKVFTAYTSTNAPTISTAKSGAVKKITTTWKKASGASGYQVRWSTTSDFSSNYKSVNATGTKTTLKTAQSKKYYYVKVRAYKTRGDKKVYSPWSKTLKVKTK